MCTMYIGARVLVGAFFLISKKKLLEPGNNSNKNKNSTVKNLSIFKDGWNPSPRLMNYELYWICA